MIGYSTACVDEWGNLHAVLKSRVRRPATERDIEKALESVVNMANRDTTFGALPTVKCSNCGAQIEIASMGDHICGPLPQGRFLDARKTGRLRSCC